MLFANAQSVQIRKINGQFQPYSQKVVYNKGQASADIII